ncbi:hypothetical protein [Synechococcus sp. PCC 6312]|uniref:hypothetical protein n=1 Tax=Synechococcus sp. (strain ATCC 27167 / PCC 6312) TaxID=195253 RepID=UPI00029EF5BC|nr:hypothetical protein [Synechococcus sp. PCC 6312]AFY60358.1 hypothetical protein Syn6312_1173 [Synechococcus sp. PCC 6312]
MANSKVLSQLHHNGTLYAPGVEVELPREIQARLAELGVIEILPEANQTLGTDSASEEKETPEQPEVEMAVEAPPKKQPTPRKRPAPKPTAQGESGE